MTAGTTWVGRFGFICYPARSGQSITTIEPGATCSARAYPGRDVGAV